MNIKAMKSLAAAFAAVCGLTIGLNAIAAASAAPHIAGGGK